MQICLRETENLFGVALPKLPKRIRPRLHGSLNQDKVFAGNPKPQKLIFPLKIFWLYGMQ